MVYYQFLSYVSIQHVPEVDDFISIASDIVLDINKFHLYVLKNKSTLARYGNTYL